MICRICGGENEKMKHAMQREFYAKGDDFLKGNLLRLAYFT